MDLSIPRPNLCQILPFRALLSLVSMNWSYFTPKINIWCQITFNSSLRNTVSPQRHVLFQMSLLRYTDNEMLLQKDMQSFPIRKGAI